MFNDCRGHQTVWTMVNMLNIQIQVHSILNEHEHDTEKKDEKWPDEVYRCVLFRIVFDFLTSLLLAEISFSAKFVDTLFMTILRACVCVFDGRLYR